ncbi:MAG: FapA family protein [Planctomycetota bacterium]
MDEAKVVTSAKIGNNILELLVGSGQMKLSGRIVPEGRVPAARESPSLDQFLETMGVPAEALRDEGRAAIIRGLASDPPPRDIILLATGTPPSLGKDGEFEWDAHLVPCYKSIGKGDTVLFRRKVIYNVAQGKVIGRIVPPTEGTSGRDVFGQTLPPPSVKPCVLKAGRNIRPNSDHTVSAEKNGLVFLDGDRLVLEEVLTVEEDVNVNTGHVESYGDVLVRKDVRDGMSVVARGGISVGGGVGQAMMKAGGDVKVHGGVAGKERGVIEADGSVTARFLMDVTVRARGDVLVEREVMNSAVMTRGRLLLKQGSIRGGRVIALEGVETLQIGSTLGVKTEVVAGVDYLVRDEMADMEKDLCRISALYDKIDHQVGPVFRDEARWNAIPAAKREILEKLRKEWERLQKERDDLQARKTEVVARTKLARDKSILVGRIIHPGTIIQIGDFRKEFEMPVQGPVRLVPWEEEETIRAVAP